MTDVRWVVVMNRFPKIINGLERKAEAAVAKAALDIEAQAKVRAPVRTGFLRSSIQADKINPLHWRVTVGAEYGLYVEYGTVHSASRPYFHPAIDLVWPAFRHAMSQVVKA